MSCEMIKIQSELLEGDALRWAVMKAEGLVLQPIFKEGQFLSWFTPDDGMPWGPSLTAYDTDWNQTGRLILKYKIGIGEVQIRAGKAQDDQWAAHPKRLNEPTNWSFAADPRVAVCKAVVIEVLGAMVEIPAFLAPGLQRPLRSV